MIDAIQCYSSHHVSRLNKSIPNQNFGRFVPTDFSVTNSDKKTPSKPKQSDFGSFLFVSGCAGAFCMILNFLFNYESVLKSDFSVMKSILKASALVAIVSGGCFALFKGLEKLIDKSSKN